MNSQPHSWVNIDGTQIPYFIAWTPASELAASFALLSKGVMPGLAFDAAWCNPPLPVCVTGGCASWLASVLISYSVMELACQQMQTDAFTCHFLLWLFLFSVGLLTFLTEEGVNAAVNHFVGHFSLFPLQSSAYHMGTVSCLGISSHADPNWPCPGLELSPESPDRQCCFSLQVSLSSQRVLSNPNSYLFELLSIFKVNVHHTN